MDGTSFSTSNASEVFCLNVTDLVWYGLIVQLLTSAHLLVYGIIDMVFAFIGFLQVISQCCGNRLSATCYSHETALYCRVDETNDCVCMWSMVRCPQKTNFAVHGC
jgi:hypothetical protein